MDVEMSCAAPEAAVSVDWRGRPCRPRRHGGMRAAVFVLGACTNGCWCWQSSFMAHWSRGRARAESAGYIAGIQAFEIMAIAAVGNNLITYVFGEMHFPLSQAANVVTNFVGTIFLLALLGGFLSDSYLGCFWTMLIFGFVELSVRC